jgi:hypothetical protein
MTWTAATDAHSGLAGYRGVWNTSASTNPTGSLNITAGATSYARTLTEGSSWYFHLRARDAAGNWGTIQHSGPYRIDLTAPSASLRIDGGSATTTSRNVSLAISATDPLSGPRRMRFRNDGGSWSAWENFATSKAWSLTNNGGSSATGTRTVDAQVRDTAGNTRTASDRIYYYAPARTFGSACAGSSGNPVFSLSGTPGIGRTVTFTTTNTAAPLQMAYLGISNTSWMGIPLPLDLAILGVPGCMVNISMDMPFFSGPVVPLAIPIPNDPLAVGAHLYFQNFLLGDPSGKLVVTTRGIDVLINGA